jgi:hypothetical protein
VIGCNAYLPTADLPGLLLFSSLPFLYTGTVLSLFDHFYHFIINRDNGYSFPLSLNFPVFAASLQSASLNLLFIMSALNLCEKDYQKSRSVKIPAAL